MTIIFYEQDTMLTWYDTWGMVAVFKRKRNGLVYIYIYYKGMVYDRDEAEAMACQRHGGSVLTEASLARADAQM